MIAGEKAADFGARLREARERRGLSLRAIADATKISVRALEALERNYISPLPGGIFSRAFVRAYAMEVGLDPEQTIADFITCFPHETVIQGHPRTRSDSGMLEGDSGQRRLPLRWLLLLLGLLIAGAITYFAMTAGAQAAAADSQGSRGALAEHVSSPGPFARR
jgi:cytoskeletal protein RodZ